MTKKIRTAIIGCGKVSQWHISALQQSDNAECVAIYSRNLDKAKEYGEQYGLLPFDNISRMIRDAGIQSVVVCTPHPYHKDAVVEAALAGAHCMVEKPLASSLQDCDIMIDVCRKAGVKLGMISQRRFLQPVQRVKKAIEDGKIGNPVLGTVNVLGWRDKAYYDSDPWRGKWDTEGGGVMVNQASHQLDILLWLMGDVEEVYGVWRNFNHPYVEIEDTALAIVKFKNSGLGNIIVSNSMKPGIYGKIQVHGSNAASVGVQVDGGSMPLPGKQAAPYIPVNDLWTVPGEEHLLDGWIKEDEELYNKLSMVVYPMQLQHEDFCDAILNDREPAVDGEAGRKTVELFTAVYRSTRDNAVIKFPLQAENGNDYDGRKS
ncbi:MAG: Gfo/Idh/MocA family oxidoreductase [Chitinophagaceae bacterium]|nr:Gfo/Idh/MocA family oxidoreductase [Chitinophagaceae bacterium]MCW5927430.1 Gfo/Idh/MocA family oxidoreductase [Chitinophagaceae bacterium]